LDFPGGGHEKVPTDGHRDFPGRFIAIGPGVVLGRVGACDLAVLLGGERKGASVKSAEEMMEILEAFDLVGTLRGAAVLAGCDHKTVAQFVRLRDEAGGVPGQRGRARPTVDPFAGKIEEWVQRSRGRIRADRAHERLVLIGLRRFGAHDAAGGRRGQAPVAG
jgi:hypothetical protein